MPYSTENFHMINSCLRALTLLKIASLSLRLAFHSDIIANHILAPQSKLPQCRLEMQQLSTPTQSYAYQIIVKKQNCAASDYHKSQNLKLLFLFLSLALFDPLDVSSCHSI